MFRKKETATGELEAMWKKTEQESPLLQEKEEETEQLTHLLRNFKAFVVQDVI